MTDATNFKPHVQSVSTGIAGRKSNLIEQIEILVKNSSSESAFAKIKTKDTKAPVEIYFTEFVRPNRINSTSAPVSVVFKAGEKKCTVPAGLRLMDENPELSLQIYLEYDNRDALRNGSMLGRMVGAGADEPEEFEWYGALDGSVNQGDNELLVWGTKSVDPESYCRIYYGNRDKSAESILTFPGVKGILSRPRVEYRGKKFQLKHAGAYPESREALDKFYAALILLRIIDWILLCAFREDNFTAVQDLHEVLSGVKNDGGKVDINPQSLQEKSESAGLYFNESIYSSVCVSLNLGRHLILTGPPGCGKSELAVILGRMVSEKFHDDPHDAHPKVVTASPSWTSGDLIGRYFPSPKGRGALDFLPGVFLQAIEANRSLVIDEINRANLDECFGELFTVLAGMAVDLPYRQFNAVNGESAIDVDSQDGGGSASMQEISQGRVVRIAPHRHHDDDTRSLDVGRLNDPNAVTYQMSKSFRLIGTMNDADRSSLHQFSFALLRRFDVIRVDPPARDRLEELVNQAVQKKYEKAWWEGARKLVKDIFCGRQGGPDGLVERGVVGVATMLAVCKFMEESARLRFDMNSRKQSIAEQLHSDFARAVLTMVAPLLDALTDDDFRDALQGIVGTAGFQDLVYSSLLASNESKGKSQRIAEVFFGELRSRYRGTGREALIDSFGARRPSQSGAH